MDEHECVRHGRVLGMFGAVDLIDVDPTSANHGNRISPVQGGGLQAHKLAAFKAAMLEEGVIAFFRNNLLHVAPPLIIT